MSKRNKDAYALTYGLLGKEVRVTDGHGIWRIHHVVRVSNTPYGPFQYVSHVTFRKHGDDLSRVFYAHIKYSDITEDGILNAVRQAVGYTPSVQVVEAFLTYIRQLIAAWEEEDNYYKARDKDQAALRLQNIIATALERVTRGEEVPVNRVDPKWGRPAFDLYLTSEEQELAREAQKELNGSAHEVPDTVPLREHLADFKKRLAAACKDKNLQINNETLIKRRQRLLELLETDVELRRLVALALVASKDIRGGGLSYELPHRLFGYTHDGNAYHQALIKLADLLKNYEIELPDVHELILVGSEYMANGGILPVAVPSFSRLEGAFAYGDRIIANGHTDKVKKVGAHYIYGEKGDHWEKTLVKHRFESKKAAGAGN